MNSAWTSLCVVLANLLWFVSCLPGWLAFLLASHNVRRAQTKVLSDIMRRNARTEYGSRFGFDAVRCPDDIGSIPVSEYEDCAALLQKVKAGQTSVLTRDPVDLLQPTSGSTAATKLIPYTRSLKRQFRAAVDPWIASLYLAHPRILFGRHYWSISPVTRLPRDPSIKVPVGFADDTEYLGSFQRFMSRALFVVPPEIARVSDPAAFEYLTLLFLLRDRNLRVISIWHPSFLTLLMQAVPKRLPEIVRAIETGVIEAPSGLPPELLQAFSSRFSASVARAGELRRLDAARPDFPSSIWPRLRVISCWTEGRAEPWVSEVRRLFPRAAIQGKGLTATEGIVSFPIGAAGRKVCAIRSHFFEFVDPASGDIKRAWEVTSGGEYSVVLTTGGGLYRYRLHDLIKVTGFYHRAPCVEFIARDNLVSDLVGEKLNSRHVGEAIRHVEEACGVRFAFTLLAPVLVRQSARYMLFMQTAAGDTSDCSRIGLALEDELSRNFHYRHARNLAQLQPLKVFRVDGDAVGAYRRFLVRKGVRAGDVKFSVLTSETDCLSAFDGSYVA